MPDILHHFEQAKRNEAFFVGFESHKDLALYSEWSITIRFYFAVHMVEGILSLFGIHSATHDERTAKLNSNSPLLPFTPKLTGAYMDLYSLSRKARYLARNGSSTSTRDLADAIDDHSTIRSECLHLFSKQKSVEKKSLEFLR